MTSKQRILVVVAAWVLPALGQAQTPAGTEPRLLATLVFWTCCTLLLYVYFLYPRIVRALAARFGTPVRRGADLPSVTLIITAYNEERCIGSKLDNISELDYPPALLSTIVVSDASSDATEEIARQHAPAHGSVLRVEGRRGKTACQNIAAANARGEVLVFADATTQLHPTALLRLVENFADAHVGCVSGRLEYVTRNTNGTGQGCEKYWSYEQRLRAAESAFGSMIGVAGCLYAVRRSAYVPIDPRLCSDFVIAWVMRDQGLRTVFAADAVCFEETLDCGGRELSMRVRVALQSLHALIQERRFLNPLKYGAFAWQLWSHKALRYLSPVLWLTAILANISLAAGPFYMSLLVAQCSVIVAGIVGFLLQARRPGLGMLGQPYYLLLTNLASLIAMLRYVRGERMVTWIPVR